MNVRFRLVFVRFLLVGCLCAALLCAGTWRPENAAAQTSAPVLVSEENSTRAVALDALTRQREPFQPAATIAFGSDQQTRIMLFAMNLRLRAGEAASAVAVEAEDGAHRVYPLAVEHVGSVPQQEWLTSVVVRLDDALTDMGDVLVRLRYDGASSNRVRVGIGHTGGGLPDDDGAVPTPGAHAPILPPNTTTAGTLTASEVQTVIAQAVSAAVQLNRAVTVAVTDREANVLGLFTMTGAAPTSQIRGGGAQSGGLEGMVVSSTAAAVSKAGTGALFSTSGNAFTTRTAGFIIQEHFPPAVNFRPSGPLYGVQYSSLPCSDIKKPGLPLGLSADAGGVPVYKNGAAVGGVGIEGDGVYGVDRDPSDFDQPFEETIAVAAVRGFEAPAQIRGDNILVDGIRLPYVNTPNAPTPATLTTLPGAFQPPFPLLGAQSSAFTPAIVGGIGGEVDTRFFPFVGSILPTAANALTASDVGRIIAQAAQQANITRAAIRQPLGSAARVTVAVVDVEGNVLGVFRMVDAPVFGFDVSVQKARSAAFFSKANAGGSLRAAGFGSYVDRAADDGLRLDGSIAFSDRAIGFLHRPFFPDGIPNTDAGTFSTPLNKWSVFNVGLQLDLVKTNLGASVCTALAGLPNGLQIFAGSIPLYKNGALVGGIGISGDGIDQDDIIAAAGSNGFAPPVAIRSDQTFVRGTRLPFVKFPRSPNL
ncbi:MAG TPA: heme-binding protein [Pyrinomonadaceae bacterium]|jgi:uncharacterized protein GlcG (DUF336 family)